MKLPRRTLLKGAAAVAGSLPATLAQASEESNDSLSSRQQGLGSDELSQKKQQQNTLASCFSNLNRTQRYQNTKLNDLAGQRRFAFLDTRQIHDVKNADLRFHVAQKHGDPVIVGDRPWEAGTILYGSVLHDGEKFRMWYEPIPPDWPARHGNPYEVSYAESGDGIHWEKPELGVLKVDGSLKNNRVNFYGHSASVIDRGPDAPPEQRYMGIAKGYAPILGVPEVMEHPVTAKHNGYWAYYSADGIHWNIFPPPHCCILQYMNDCASFISDPWRGRLIGAVKFEPRVGLYDRRSVTISTAPDDDVLNWSSPRLAVYPDEMDDQMARNRGTRWAEIHHMGLMATRDVIIGFPELFWVEDFHPGQAPGVRLGYKGKMEIQMAYSYDGYAWHRPTGRASFIPLGKQGEWDDGALTVGHNALEYGDDVLIYYTGGQNDFFSIDDARVRKIGLAKIGRDRFASLATDKDGYVDVYHGMPEGESIVINARTNAGGQIRVEPRITAGKSSNPIDGFTRQQCSPIHGDSVRHPVSWNGKGWRDLRPDADLVLRFYLQNAEVFAYEIV